MLITTSQLSHQIVAPHVTSKLDQHALSFLEDIELKQDVNDFRPYELVFVRPLFRLDRGCRLLF